MPSHRRRAPTDPDPKPVRTPEIPQRQDGVRVDPGARPETAKRRGVPKRTVRYPTTSLAQTRAIRKFDPQQEYRAPNEAVVDGATYSGPDRSRQEEEHSPTPHRAHSQYVSLPPLAWVETSRRRREGFSCLVSPTLSLKARSCGKTKVCQGTLGR